MRKITKIGVLSLGKVMGMSGLLMGLLVGVPLGLLMMLGGVIGGASGQEGAGVAAVGGIGMGLIAMILIPIGYGAASFIGGLIYGLILNLVLHFAGGLELEIQ